VKDAVTAINLGHACFEKLDVSSHSLQAGGAMAMYINKHTTIEIQWAGYWMSTTFLEYIHSQLSSTS